MPHPACTFVEGLPEGVGGEVFQRGLFGVGVGKRGALGGVVYGIGAFTERGGGGQAGECAYEIRRIHYTCRRWHQRNRDPEGGVDGIHGGRDVVEHFGVNGGGQRVLGVAGVATAGDGEGHHRSEEHTSELQSLSHLVCRL